MLTREDGELLLLIRIGAAAIIVWSPSF